MLSSTPLNPDLGDGRRAGDTDLVRAVQTLLSSTNYVFHTTAFADEVFGLVNTIKELSLNKTSSINIPVPPNNNTVLHIAVSTKAPFPPNVSERTLVEHPERYFRVRNDVVHILLEAGANPFLCNSLGQTAIDIADEGIHRESLVAALIKYRTATEGAVLSVPPLDASRLMKRSETDTGYAVFSNVCKHCVYYLYKGAVLLWDLKEDVQHTVYQPRDSDPKIQALEKQFTGFERRKSIAVRGAAAGSGMWTSNAASTGANPAPTLNQEEGDRILRELAKLEAKVPLVSNFVMVTGVDATMATAAGREGVVEWVMCNTGAVVGVRLNEQGVKLHRGFNNGFARKQSQICGIVAEYPEGLTIDVSILHQCPIRFSRRANASHVTCAMDGLRGKVGYVVAQRNLAAVRPPPPSEGFNPFAACAFEAPSTPPFSVGRNRVKFDVSSSGAKDELEESVPEASKISKSFVSVDDGHVFRLASVNRGAFPPKATMGEIFEELCDAEDAFDHLMQYTDYTLPLEYGDPICVSQCGDDVFVLFCSGGVIVGDLTERIGGPHATFTDVSNFVRPSGFIRYGVASAPQRFRPIKSDAPRHLIVVQSDTVEVCELVRNPESGSFELRAILRTTEDRCVPHRFTPFFHGSADELIIAYQSLKKTELSVFNLTTHTLQSYCKLPKPSSLRFYQTTTEGKQQVGDLPVSVFAIAAQDGQYLLRYNVTMHVMSVYSWEEILQRSAAKKIPFVNSVFVRDPIKIKDKSQVHAYLGSRGRASVATPAQQLSSFPRAWLFVECEVLQKYMAKHGLTAAGINNREGPHEQLVDNIHNVVGDAFRKAVCGAGGTCVTYTPPPFTLIVDEEERNTQEEIDALEAEYLAQRPRHEGVWCASFNDTLDALRVGLQLLRVLTNDGKWSQDVLALPEAAVIEEEYTPKSHLERLHPEFTSDPNACKFVQRGPPIRPLVVAGTTATSAFEALRSHRMFTDVRNNVELSRRNPVPLPPPVNIDGVVVMEVSLFRDVKPMLDLMGVLPPVTAKVPLVDADTHDSNSPTTSPISRAKAAPPKQLCIVAPAELKRRLSALK